MLNKANNNESELWTRLKEELNQYQQDNGIEYLDYKKRLGFNYESEKQNFEHEFYYFPCDSIVANERMQIFHTFYETDVWGILGPVRLGDEQLDLSQRQIESNVAIDRAKYILDKLVEKYSYIEDNIHRALIGPKRYFQLPENYEETPILVNLQNLYSSILSTSESQLVIFEYINLNKTISDIYTELLYNHIKDRIKTLNPRLKQYRKKVKRTMQVEASEMSKEIPLIKLGYNPDQQTQIIQFLFDNLSPEYIEVSYPQFERHFSKKRSKIKQMIWNGKEAEIVQLFRSMKIKNILIVENQNKMIEQHFLNNKGAPFNYRQLSVSISKTKIESFPEILHIIDNLEKLVLTFN